MIRSVTSKRLKENNSLETLNSYLGLLKHGNTELVKNKVLKLHIENYGLDEKD